MNLGFPISEVSSTPFSIAGQLHTPKPTPDSKCGSSNMFGKNKSDQLPVGSSNPWTRLLLGHRVLVNPNYRPPKTENIRYNEVATAPTTGHGPSFHLA